MRRVAPATGGPAPGSDHKGRWTAIPNGRHFLPHGYVWAPYDVAESEASVPCLGAATPCTTSLPHPRRRRPGKTISKGHKNYQLMLNLQLGIRYLCVRGGEVDAGAQAGGLRPRREVLDAVPARGVQADAAAPVPRVPVEGLLPHGLQAYEGAVRRRPSGLHARGLRRRRPAGAVVAREERELLLPHAGRAVHDQDRQEVRSEAVDSDAAELLQARQAVQELSDHEVLRRSLCEAVRWAEGTSAFATVQATTTLAPSASGLFLVYYDTWFSLQVRFIVMGNLFSSEHRIHRRYDLKGSSYGRKSDKFEQGVDEATTLKDLDLDFVFRMQRSQYKQLHEQLRRDCVFLESEGIMDYSLLVGVHFRDDTPAPKVGSSALTISPEVSGNMVSTCQGSVGMPEPCLSAKDLDRMLDHRKPLPRLGACLPARAERRTSTSKTDSFLSGGGSGGISRKNAEACYDVVLYFGIIDILQEYDMSKKLEHAYKSLQTDPGSISAVDPKLYSQRFRDFMGRVFVKDG
ncbi:unnamed protein product [Alopecurus aequalis]